VKIVLLREMAAKEQEEKKYKGSSKQKSGFQLIKDKKRLLFNVPRIIKESP
jgi:hypothetical protein